MINKLNENVMLVKADILKIYETVLSVPGMNEPVKIVLNLQRKNVLLLSKVIERGLSGKEADDKTIGILDIVPEQTLLELGTINTDLMEKAGLTEMNKKLQSF